jgi:type VI secretion system secreted protein Hcp
MNIRLNNKKNSKWLWALVGVVYLIPLVAVQGAVDFFLKIEGVDGESVIDEKHKGEIDIQSFSWGVSNPTTHNPTGGGRVSGPLSVGEITVTKRNDKASPVIAKSVANGKHFPKVEINIVSREAGVPREKYLTYKLEDVIISSYSVSGSSSGDALPTESLSLNFTKVEYGYADYDLSTGSSTNQTNVVIDVPTAD